MTKLTILIKLFTVILLTGCATSMTPTQVNDTLPTLTKSKFISQSQANEVVENNRCKYLIRSRNYVAPIGLTTKEDLKQAAKGIDEWVKLDGGNAYVLKNYEWVTVDHFGSTQLRVEFDTMICE